MGHRPFRFGISFGGAMTLPELAEQARRAEDAGFTVACTADHISPRHAVLPFLATVAQVSSMRISPMVIANDYRHPVVLAQDCATIDILSEGRFELGVGTGWIEEQYRAAGIPYEAPGVRVDRFEEAISVIKGCWSGGPFTFSGEHYRVDGVESLRPVQEPHPPLLIAGSGRRMMRIAGREADIVGISPLPRGATAFDSFGPGMASSGRRFEAQKSWIREGAGRRFEEIELSVAAHHLEVGGDAVELATPLADSWATTVDDVLASPHVLLGDAGRLVDVIEERREIYGISYLVFLGFQLEAVEPVVRRLSGS